MKNLRKIHINNQEWKWIVESLNYCTIKEIRIYSPSKKMWRIKPEKISTLKTGYDEWFENYVVTPQMVKNYIETNILT